jgi:hypothetical protein
MINAVNKWWTLRLKCPPGGYVDMKATRQRNLILMATIFVMVLSLFNTGIVFADDGRQPPVEPVVTEEPLATDEPADAPEPVATDEPALITDPTSKEETVQEEMSVQEILEQVPDEMTVIVLDEQGQPGTAGAHGHGSRRRNDSDQ